VRNWSAFWRCQVPDQRFDNIVEEALTEVLETMFFTSVIGDAGDGGRGGLLWAKVDFDGQPSGWLSLGVSRSAASDMAETFLGLEEPAGEQLSAEVVRELANMVCGTILSRGESDTHFELSEPSLVAEPPAPSTRRAFELENGVVELCFDIR